MARLISFGCSMTKGAGLPDIYDEKTKYHIPDKGGSQYAWPEIVAEKAGLICVNHAVNASSNKLIANRVLDFDFIDGDIPIIMWSYPERHAVILKDSFLQIHRTSIKYKELSQNYYDKQYNEYDSLINSMNYIQLIKYHLPNAIHLSVADFNYPSKSWFNIDISKNYMVDYIHAFGVNADGYHPSVKAHEKFGVEIWKKHFRKSRFYL